jgi:hypothetical protein
MSGVVGETMQGKQKRRRGGERGEEESERWFQWGKRRKE